MYVLTRGWSLAHTSLAMTPEQPDMSVEYCCLRSARAEHSRSICLSSLKDPVRHSLQAIARQVYMPALLNGQQTRAHTKSEDPVKLCNSNGDIPICGASLARGPRKPAVVRAQLHSMIRAEPGKVNQEWYDAECPCAPEKHMYNCSNAGKCCKAESYKQLLRRNRHARPRSAQRDFCEPASRTLQASCSSYRAPNVSTVFPRFGNSGEFFAASPIVHARLQDASQPVCGFQQLLQLMQVQEREMYTSVAATKAE